MKPESPVPEFAVVGHPNEGKSSVLSTLAEDDTVPVSPVPGETRECRRFPVFIDHREVIAFIDTPGFQNPRRTLDWMRNYDGPLPQMLRAFIEAHRMDPAFRDDCRLLEPLSRGAGIIFVADGSRPLREVDRAEMEILRLTGLPRMAILNCKEEETAFLEDWQQAFRRHFNSTRLFNTLRATYGERMALLGSLRSMDQDLEPVLTEVIQVLERDWQAREEESADLILDLLEEVLTWTRTRILAQGQDPETVAAQMRDVFATWMRRREEVCRQRIRRLFRHHVFSLAPEAHSLLAQDLFARQTWKFLGLSRGQLITTGALGGAAVGAGMDLAHAGLTFGVFSALGGVVGATAAAWRGRELLSRLRLLGLRLDRRELTLGPVANPQLMYVLLDRSLLYYRWVINWAHARRERPLDEEERYRLERQGCLGDWPAAERRCCREYFQALTGKVGPEERSRCRHQLGNLLLEKMRSWAGR